MLGEKRLAELARKVLDQSKAEQTEVLITGNDAHLTRFAANTIHQNVSETNVSVRVRAIVGHRTGVASTNELDDESLRRVVEAAETVASFQKENPEIASLPEPMSLCSIDAYVNRTADFTPMERARGAETVLRAAREAGLEAAGAFSVEEQELYVGNSCGVSAYHRGTVAGLLTVIMGRNSSGYASAASIDVADIDPAEIGRCAVDKALRSADPTDIEPGEYTVILEEEAVADMVFFLGYLGMGALSLQEGRSFMSGRLGERVTGEDVTIWDDGSDPRGLPMPFDFEGVAKRKVMLIENGIARGVVYDSATAGREAGATSTGHSLPAPNTVGPIPINLFMAPGDATKEELLASTERGIWVTRFHYTNPVHPVKAILTGMTRDGTFLIENGKITRPLKNLRFTQGILEALASIEGMTKKLKMVKDEWNPIATCVPAIKVRGFRFTGTTEF